MPLLVPPDDAPAPRAAQEAKHFCRHCELAFTANYPICRLMKHIISLLIACLMLGTASFANPYEDKAKFRLLPGWTEPDGTRIAALEVVLANGWKTYWRAPGDAGVPPQFDWSASRNLKSVSVRWPQPVVFHQAGMRTIGYENRLILPFVVTPKRKGKPVVLKGVFDLGICKDICVPVHVNLEQLIAPTDAQNQAEIKAALANEPITAARAGVKALSCEMRPSSEDGVMLKVTMQLASLGGREDAAIETGDPLVWATEPKLSRSGKTLTLEMRLVHALGGSFALNRTGLRITLLGGKRSVDIQGC